MRITRVPWRRSFFGALLCGLSVLACGPAPESALPGEQSPETDTQQQPVVYGLDDRTDVYAYPLSVLRDRAEQSTVALMGSSAINTSNPDNITFNASTLRSANNLCSDQRFLEDPAPAFCSGTLIDDDLVLTAGNCIRLSDCPNTRFVFNFYRTSATALKTVTTADVFSCRSVVVHSVNVSGGRVFDYAIVRLDRAATPRFVPAPIRPGNTALQVGTGVSVIGSSSGIPFKIDDGGRVRDGRAGTLDYFVATTDTSGASLGSGVYENDTFTVAGIRVRGEMGLINRGSCRVVNRCTETGCRGEDITYARLAVDHFCRVAASPRLCDGSEPPPLPPPPPPLPPSPPGTPFSFSASNTDSAQVNTTDYAIAMLAGQTLTIGTCGQAGASFTGDTYLRLRGVRGTEVAYSHGACGGQGSSITYRAPADGNYVVNAGCYASGACSGDVAWMVSGDAAPTRGSFTFSARNTNFAQQNTVNQDVFVAEGQRITVATCGQAGASFSGDTILRLFSDAALVASNDNACGGVGSSLTYIAHTTTTLQMRAGCYAGNACSGTVVWNIQ
ncbi:Trypsin domain protein [Myxococcus hansupus]|uniref:Trypsin domain protein n=1 Tax=Pseudomyxococcus hansupus TaxID=1297742 RepID=A0A0H4XMJ2_9BACT|nr:trypsin-like serine protease [Myxococcus hansupus]AKQ69517.1 Trypsin domain protein [Myxococcus hansupus]